MRAKASTWNVAPPVFAEHCAQPTTTRGRRRTVPKETRRSFEVAPHRFESIVCGQAGRVVSCCLSLVRSSHSSRWIAADGNRGTVDAMTGTGVTTRPAATVAHDIHAALKAKGLADRFSDLLTPLFALTDLADG